MLDDIVPSIKYSMLKSSQDSALSFLSEFLSPAQCVVYNKHQ